MADKLDEMFENFPPEESPLELPEAGSSIYITLPLPGIAWEKDGRWGVLSPPFPPLLPSFLLKVKE